MPKLAERLTDIKIKNLKVKAKPYKMAAGRGLHLLVKIDGSKHWQFRYLCMMRPTVRTRELVTSHK